MRTYFFIYLLTLLLCYVVPAKDQKEYLKKLIIVFIPLFLFGALRDKFSDSITYEGIYEEIQLLSSFVYDEYAHSEIGYQLLCYIMPSFRALLVFTAALMCVSFITFFYKNVPPKGLIVAISLLFLSGNLSIFFILSSMRNGIAISLFILFFSFWQDRKILLATIVTLVASTMHTSALFSLPLAFFVGRTTPFNKRELTIWIGAIVFFTISSTTSLLLYIEPIINTYFNRYDSVIREGIERGDTSHLLGNFGSIILFALLASFVYRFKEFAKRDISLLRVAMLFPFALIMTTLNARMSQFFSLIIIAATSIIYAKCPKSDLKTTYICMVFAYVGYFFYLWTQSTWFNYTVYHSVLGSF